MGHIQPSPATVHDEPSAIQLTPNDLPVVAGDGVHAYTLASPVVSTPKHHKLLRQDACYDIVELRNDRGELVTRHALRGNVTADEQQCFREGVERWNGALQAGVEGVLRILEVGDDRRWADTPCPVGTMTDLPALNWSLPRLLELIEQVCWTVSGLHNAGVVHGCLAPFNIWLDDEIKPQIAGVGLTNLAHCCGGNPVDLGYRAYSAPEALRGRPEVGSDVYSIGMLLCFALLGAAPTPSEEPLPRLKELGHVPAGLVRIVRKCTAKDPLLRYRTVYDLIADLRRYGRYQEVGLAHPEVDDTNHSGLMRAGARVSEPVAPSSIPGRLRAEKPEPPRSGRLAAAIALTIAASVLVGWLIPWFAHQ